MSATAGHPAVSVPPDFPGFEHRMVDAGALRTHLVEGGDGDPVLMLHGWPQHFWCWRHVAPALAERYRVICPDLRGFGWTDVPPDGHDPETYAADARALLDALEIERAFVVGHDWGGFSSLLLALRHPERVRALLALNVPLPWRSRAPARDLPGQARRAWYTWVVAMPFLGEALLKRPEAVPRVLDVGTVRPGVTREDAALYAARLAEPERARASVSLYRAYQRIAFEVGVRGRYEELRLTVPARLMLSDRDPGISPRPATGWETHADQLAVELIEGCGHFTPEEAPELVVERALALFGDG